MLVDKKYNSMKQIDSLPFTVKARALHLKHITKYLTRKLSKADKVTIINVNTLKF